MRKTEPRGGRQPAGGAEPVARPADPERGLRGAMSATLILEAIVVLLAIPVARNTGAGTPARRRGGHLPARRGLYRAVRLRAPAWFVTAALALQVLVIVGWIITPSLGVMGIVFRAGLGVHVCTCDRVPAPAGGRCAAGADPAGSARPRR